MQGAADGSLQTQEPEVNMNEIKEVNVNEMTRSKRKLINTVFDHARKYIGLMYQQQKCPVDSLDDLQPQDLTENIIVEFAWMEILNDKFGNKVVSEIYPASKYRQTRRSLRQHYVSKASDTGTRLVDSAIPMSASDYENICFALMKGLEDRNAYNHRALLVLQWQCFVTINEIAPIQISQLDLMNYGQIDFMKVTINRFKGSEAQDIYMAPHRNNWLICPMHAIASVIAVNLSSDAIFTKEINDRSKEMTDFISKCAQYLHEEHNIEIAKGLSSHSVRHGAATYCSAVNIQLKDTHINKRGRWNAGLRSQVHHHITAVDSIQSARAISGWPDITTGGACLTLPDVQESDRELFCDYCGKLFPSVNAKLKFALGATLVMYYPQMKELKNESLIITRMRTVSDDINDDILVRWSESLKTAFQRKQFSSVSLENAQNDSSSVQVNLDTTCIKSEVHSIHKLLLMQQQQISAFCNAVSNLSQSVSNLSQSVNSRFTTFEAKLVDIANRNNNNTSANTDNSSASNIASNEQHTVATSTMTSSIHPSLITSHFPEVTTPVRKLPTSFPTDLYDLKGVTMSQVFYRWYTERLFDHEINTDQCSDPTIKKQLQAVKDIQTLIMKCVGYMKRFLESNTTISVPPIDTDSSNIWCNNLIRIGNAAEERLYSFVNANRSDRTVTTSTTTRNRKIHRYVYGLVKRLILIPSNKFPNPINIIDEVTPVNFIADPVLTRPMI